MDWIEGVAKDSMTGWAFGGDLNWRRCFADHLTEHQQLCKMIKPTTIVETHPSRLVTRSFKAEHLDSTPVPGIPHHCLVTFSIEVSFTEVATTRLKRTAVYKDNAESIFLPQDAQEVQDNIEAELPVLPDEAPLPDQRRRWRARAEATLEAAVERSW